MQEWLLSQRSLKFIDITADARHAIHLGKGSPHQKALIKVMVAECKEFFEGLQLANGMLRLVGSSSRVFSRDFAVGIMDLRGMAYNPHTGATEIRTLGQVLDESAEYLMRSLWFIGPPGYGKTTLIAALAQEVAHRQGFDSFCESTALDPFGQLTKMGICEKVGAFAISDFDLTSGGGGFDNALSLSDMTSLLDCSANASFKARYHCATLPKHRSRLFAINPTAKDGQINWGGWFADQGYPIIEAFVNGQPLDSYGDRHKALLRRMIIFKVTSPLYDLRGAAADPELELLRMRGGARAYQL
jgi:energy-coupling factor transporter ATP-binding protein EcfA2